MRDAGKKISGELKLVEKVRSRSRVLCGAAKYSGEDRQLIAETIEDDSVPNALLIATSQSILQVILHGKPTKGVGEEPAACVPSAVIRALEKSVGR